LVGRETVGDSTPHIAEVATEINALAVRASVLNPNLGTADQIVNQRVASRGTSSVPNY
jgi:hypothetical protein